MSQEFRRRKKDGLVFPLRKPSTNLPPITTHTAIPKSEHGLSLARLKNFGSERKRKHQEKKQIAESIKANKEKEQMARDEKLKEIQTRKENEERIQHQLKSGKITVQDIERAERVEEPEGLLPKGVKEKRELSKSQFQAETKGVSRPHATGQSVVASPSFPQGFQTKRKVVIKNPFTGETKTILTSKLTEKQKEKFEKLGSQKVTGRIGSPMIEFSESGKPIIVEQPAPPEKAKAFSEMSEEEMEKLGEEESKLSANQALSAILARPQG